MFPVSVIAGRASARKSLALAAAIAVSLWMPGVERSAAAETAPQRRDFSGWRGGIGITFGTPSRDIADVTEMGYEIVWGGEDPRAIKTLGVSVFRYWNSIVWPGGCATLVHRVQRLLGGVNRSLGPQAPNCQAPP